MAGQIVSTQKLMLVGAAGVGAIGAGMLANQNLGGSALVNDLIVIGAGLAIMAFVDGANGKAFALGLGAVGVANLVGRQLALSSI